MIDFNAAREAMLKEQIAERGIDDPAIIEAMRRVPREMFVADEMAALAYEDTPLPIPAGQTISQPFMTACMLEAAQIEAKDRVLEVGAGSGYAAAVMSHLAARVDAIERHGELAARAAERMRRLGYANVAIHHADGCEGLPARAPYNAILVAARADEVPPPLTAQLAPGGRLIIPLGGANGQMLVRLSKRSDGGFDEERLCAVRFVPLVAGREND